MASEEEDRRLAERWSRVGYLVSYFLARRQDVREACQAELEAVRTHARELADAVERLRECARRQTRRGS